MAKKGGRITRVIRERAFSEEEFKSLLGIPHEERLFTVTKQDVEEHVPKGKISRRIIIVNTETGDDA